MVDLFKKYPEFAFEPGDTFRWSPSTKTITYIPKRVAKQAGQLSLLHEICHGLLSHQDYSSDLELVRMEVAAWRKTRSVARSLGMKVDEGNIEHCLDTYRDWLFARSQCPTCAQTGLQLSDLSYRCFICNESWQVPARQICLVKRYRKSELAAKPAARN